MKTTLTDFQRGFKNARLAADSGEDVMITDPAGHTRYLFTRYIEEANPFAGLEHVFGSVRLGQDHRSVREKVRARLKTNRGR